jgi:hypothetical protein
VAVGGNGTQESPLICFGLGLSKIISFFQTRGIFFLEDNKF